MDNLYISSTSRSGSTLLAEYICQLSNVVSLGELMYWSIEDFNNINCTCGSAKCKYLVELGHKINKKDTNTLLYYWQQYEEHLFGTYKNKELYSVDTSDRELNLDIVYTNIINAYKRIFGENNIFIDNTKNVDILRDLIKRNINIFKGVILTRDIISVIESYINSGKRKNVSRDVKSKISEIKYFLETSRGLLENNGGKVIHIRYEDFINNPNLIGNQILRFINYNKSRLDVVLSDDFPKTSHLVKGNHFMYTAKRIKINKEIINSTFVSDNIVEIIKGDDKLIALLNYFGYQY